MDNSSNAPSYVLPPPPSLAGEGHGIPAVRVVGVDETPRTGRKAPGGSWSGHHGFRGLKWGQDNLALP